MADISRLQTLVDGVQRGVDLSQNTLVVGSVKVGTSSPTELTKTILDKLVLVQNAADSDGTFDSKYTQISDLASTASAKGASLVGIQDSGGSFAATTVEGALQELAAAIGTGSAGDISYDNTSSGLVATNVQAAIDEVQANVEAVETVANAAIPLTQKGANNGVASLDAGGKVPASQLPSTVMELKGEWDASTNTPTLVDGTGDAGDIYEVSVAGTQDLGSGNIDFAVGDWIVYGANGLWYKSVNSNEVVSVNGQVGVVVLDTDDIAEGSNEYFTDLKAQTAVVAASIVDGDTTHSPSGDVVFEALALKADQSDLEALDDRVTDLENETSLTGKTLNTSNILVGDGSNLSAAVNTSSVGDALVTAAGGIVVKSNAITNGKIASNAITGPELATSSVSLSKLATDSVDSTKIQNGAVTSVKIGSGAVVSGKIATDAVSTGNIQDQAVTADKLADGAVSAPIVTYTDGSTGQFLSTATTVQGALDQVSDKLANLTSANISSTEAAGEALTTGVIALRYGRASDSGFVAGRMYAAGIDTSVNDNFYVSGLTVLSGSVSAGDPILVVRAGLLTVAGASYTPGAVMYLTTGGALTSTVPTADGSAVVKVGVCKDSTTIDVQIQVMGVN